MALLLPLLAFLFASLLVTAGAIMLSPRRATTLEQRLGELTGAESPSVGPSDRWSGFIAFLQRVGNHAPRSSKETGKLEKLLVYAGYRKHEAIYILLGLRLTTAIGLFLLMTSPLFPSVGLMFPLMVCGIGYLLPTMILGRLGRRRQHRIRLALPDALDLLVVSVEAGLGLDQAIQRVAEELAFAHPDLSDELRLVNLELRAGTDRAEALRNLATRTDVDDVSSLVAMLIQTDKFGTSVAQSLRVHSDTVRTKRKQRAEEAAAKTGVKMVFPLVFCIFPAIWVVTIGPAAIKFVQVLFPIIEQNQ